MNPALRFAHQAGEAGAVCLGQGGERQGGIAKSDLISAHRAYGAGSEPGFLGEGDNCVRLRAADQIAALVVGRSAPPQAVQEAANGEQPLLRQCDRVYSREG